MKNKSDEKHEHTKIEHDGSEAKQSIRLEDIENTQDNGIGDEIGTPYSK